MMTRENVKSIRKSRGKARCRAIAGLLAVAVLCAGVDTWAWGPRAQNAVVATAFNLLIKTAGGELGRFRQDVLNGCSVSLSEVDRLYPQYGTDPVNAIMTEMALLSSAGRGKFNAYFAYRLGLLGKMVAIYAAPMRDAPVTYRNLYYSDADKAIDTIRFEPRPRRPVDGNYFPRLAAEVATNNELILSEYRSGIGFGGAASQTFSQSASLTVAAILDVWTQMLAGNAIQGSVSDAQLRDYVLEGCAYYLANRSMAEFEAALKNFSAIVAMTPDLRIRLGDMLYDRGQQERAIREYEQALAEAPDRRDIAQRVSRYYLDRGKEQLARNALEDALKSLEQAVNADALNEEAVALRVDTEQKIAERDARQQAFQAALKRGAELRNLAEQEIETKRIAEGISLLAQAEAAFSEVTDEFPMEAQQRDRSIKEIRSRIAQLKNYLLSSVSSYSGSDWKRDLRAAVATANPRVYEPAIRQLAGEKYADLTRVLSSEFKNTVDDLER
ncbi:MAG TPA: hypothetical protein PK379_05760 [Candidatus Hydrogenedentes bacterium]|nr:hypothetical protein [Candidatus Hydrogenedentota bacterium]HOK89512.1 hypothetical protein [Candidatus Hydrogenedentota bacterium]